MMELCCWAAINGHLEIVKLCKEWGATDYDGAMWWAAINGHLEIVKLCKEWGATDYDGAMCWAAINGHLEIVKLCKEWGATDYDGAMWRAAINGHLEIVRLCRGWLDYDAIHDDLLRHHHKREFYGGLKDELLPIAWHPDRWWDWCVDEDEKRITSDQR